jgi:hypothetical protein
VGYRARWEVHVTLLRQEQEASRLFTTDDQSVVTRSQDQFYHRVECPLLRSFGGNIYLDHAKPVDFSTRV